MKFSIDNKYITGTAIPVSALRSEMSCGIGEFSDIKLLGDWCKEVGIELIQLLPVNDTGYQSSPYSALSAFALHPIYIRVSEIKESSGKECEKIYKKWLNNKKVDFNGILKDKLTLLKEIYNKNKVQIQKDIKIINWEKNNQWITDYAIFSHLKEINDFINWEDWTEYKNPTEADLKKLKTSYIDEIFFYSWVQYNLELQLKEATNYLEGIGINLKGDLPILMNADSADVWHSRDIFDLDHRAGAPPDMFSSDGQNWGFPTYFWENMEKNDYQWWKSRLKQASKFYHAYRIDHVLGFFRIWSIPSKYSSGSMGYYRPNNFMTKQDLYDLSFSDERIKWLTVPHIPGYELREKVGLESNEIIKRLLIQIENEDLYLFNDSVVSVDDIKNCEDISEEAANKMVNFYHNVTILQVEEDSYIPSWYYQNTRAFHTLSDHEKYHLSEILDKNSKTSLDLWKNQGLKLLKFMKDSEDMLVCAEDLGAVPDCVPEVLEQLEILGLHVTRWAKKYGEYGEPYIKPSEYNYLSVSTPAVHDSSTVRQWLDELTSTKELSAALNLDSDIGSGSSEEHIYKIYKSLLNTSSKIAMFQFQDLLAIDSNLCRKDPNEERVNIPGTVGGDNWSYRMDLTIEDLIIKQTFNKNLKKLLATRRNN